MFVAPGDAAVRPLGSTGYEVPYEGFVVAGRFGDDDVPTVVRLLHAHGGRIIARRVEGATPDIGRVLATRPASRPARTSARRIDRLAARQTAAPPIPAAAGPDGARPSHVRAAA